MRVDPKQEPMFYTSALTDDDILLCFANKQEELTRRQIAERVFRKYTPSLVARIELMVGGGLLAKRQEPLANGKLIFWYRRLK